MRLKYNRIIKNSINIETGYIYRFFNQELELVLNPEWNSLNVDFESIYVNMPVENRLMPFKAPLSDDRCVFLTGVTGCGKSSVLNHLFQIESKGVHITDETLYIPFSFDHNIFERTKERITDYYISVIKLAQSLVKGRLDQKNITTSEHDLFTYIETVRKEALHFVDGTEYERLEALSERATMEYQMLKLKYYLSILNEIKHVLLVVDDIESLGHELELVPIDYSMILWSCLKYQTGSYTKMWSSGLVISCRHFVYRMLRTRQLEKRFILHSKIDSQTLESYPLDNEINIPVPARLEDIINKRISVLRNTSNKKGWDTAVYIVQHMLSVIDREFGDFITAVCIGNIRKALTVFKKVVFNKRWIQRDWQGIDETQGAFSIENINQFNLNPPCLLRAICLGEGNVYDGEDGIVPNIMHNYEDPSTDLITLIVLRAFMKGKDEPSYDWSDTIDRDEILEKLYIIFSNKDIQKHINKSINHLIKHRLLLRGKTQAQDDGLDLDDEDIEKIRIIYVSRAAIVLWQQLKRSSVLFELYTDDFYMEYASQNLQSKKNFNVFDEQSFIKCMNHLEKMINQEGRIRIDAKNAGLLDKLNDLIGEKFITEQLFNGLSESARAYYKTNSHIYTDSLTKLKQLIESYRARLSL